MNMPYRKSNLQSDALCATVTRALELGKAKCNCI